MVTAVGLATLLLLVGCDSKWGLLRSSQDTAQIPAQTPTTTQLVTYLNQCSQQIQTLECAELDLDCQQRLQSFGLHGRMTCQKGHNFRLVADALGNRQVDMGSNEQEFWWWIAKGDPYLIHCSYQDLSHGVNMPFPFQPDWVMEALGMAEYGPAEQYRLVVRSDTLELIQETVNSQRQKVFKVTVFHRAPCRPPKPQVIAHKLQDARGKDICSATITEVQVVDKNVVIPKRIVLDWPAERVQLKMKLDDVTLNRRLDPQLASSLFNRPIMPNVPGFDLATRSVDGEVRRAGGATQSR
jgi:hypothetical protein